jgi:FCP1-like phosphatase family protein
MLTSLISSAEGVCCEWKRSDQPRNKSVKRGDRLVSIKTLTETIHVISPCSGSIKSILIKEGCNVVNGDVMAYIEHCKHPALFNSLCVSCGEKVAVISSSQTEQGNTMANGTSISHQNKASNAHSSSLLFAGGQRLLLSKDEALRVQQSKSLGLQSVRKLALVLDLDHTLVHATGAWPGYAATLGSLLGNSSSDIKRIYIEEGPGMPPKCYLVKQRPQLEAFLKEAHTLFQMTIYTAGTRRYAEAVAKLMDPLGIYFAGRIVSRSDIPNDKSDGLDKSLQRIFLKDASMVVVMDDREDVWKGDQVEQLLLVKPFHYFTGCEEVNNVAGSPAAPLGPVILLAGERPGSLLDPNTIPKSFVSPSAAKSVNSQNDHDDQLPRCLTLLRKIHKKFFLANAISLSAPTFTSQPEGSTVAKIINEMKLTILAGCSIAFSGVIPVKLPVEQHHFWRLAESLGSSFFYPFYFRYFQMYSHMLFYLFI